MWALLGGRVSADGMKDLRIRSSWTKVGAKSTDSRLWKRRKGNTGRPCEGRRRDRKLHLQPGDAELCKGTEAERQPGNARFLRASARDHPCRHLDFGLLLQS